MLIFLFFKKINPLKHERQVLIDSDIRWSVDEKEILGFCYCTIGGHRFVEYKCII